MDQDPLDVHSFIIKIWTEQLDETRAQVEWRGRITHVSSGNVRHLRSVQEIVDFVNVYLQKMGVRTASSCRWRRHLWWLRRATGEE